MVVLGGWGGLTNYKDERDERIPVECQRTQEEGTDAQQSAGIDK